MLLLSADGVAALRQWVHCDSDCRVSLGVRFVSMGCGSALAQKTKGMACVVGYCMTPFRRNCRFGSGVILGSGMVCSANG